MKYFEIFFDIEKFPHMWLLNHPLDSEGEGVYLFEKLIENRRKVVSISIEKRYVHRFKPVDVTFTRSADGMLVVKSYVADIIEAHGGKICRFPIVLTPDNIFGYEAIFTLEIPKNIIDLTRANEYEFWTEEDERPDRLGQLNKISDLYLDTKSMDSSLVIFRPWEWQVALIINEPLKLAFEEAGVTGICYYDVS